MVAALAMALAARPVIVAAATVLVVMLVAWATAVFVAAHWSTTPPWSGR